MADDKSEGPLPSEELEKDGEEGGTFLKPEDAPGHTLPESERDRFGMKPEKGAQVAPPTIIPPD